MLQVLFKLLLLLRLLIYIFHRYFIIKENNKSSGKYSFKTDSWIGILIHLYLLMDNSNISNETIILKHATHVIDLIKNHCIHMLRQTRLLSINNKEFIDLYILSYNTY